MNSNDISSKTNAGLSRIKRVSQIVRYTVLANMVFNLVFFLKSFPPRSISGSPEPILPGFLGILLEASVILWFWELARLFRFYERGLIFAAETIRCIKKLGIICVCGWLIMVALHCTTPPGLPLVNPHPGSQMVVVAVNHYDPFLSIYPFCFIGSHGAGIDFGLLIVGATVAIAAWIMDEGRKMQDEQELTV